VKQGNIPCWSLHRSRVRIFRMRVDLYLIKLPNYQAAQHIRAQFIVL
jgi:hypothetical protein